MAKQLIDSMAGDWKPDDYQDEFRARLEAVLKKRIKAKGGTTRIEETPTAHEEETTNVVDFMSLLQKSLEANKRTPAKSAAKAAKKAPARKAAKKATKAAGKSSAKSGARKAPARRKAG